MLIVEAALPKNLKLNLSHKFFIPYHLEALRMQIQKEMHESRL